MDWVWLVVEPSNTSRNATSANIRANQGLAAELCHQRTTRKHVPITIAYQ